MAAQNWENIKQGVIDDSDVFSIIVDPEQPNMVYASACSGIYKSDNGGARFQEDPGNSRDRTAHPRPAPGPGASRHRVRGHDRRLVQDHGCGAGHFSA